VSTEQFDGLTRKLAGGISRRRALRLLGGAVVGAALSRTRVLPGAHGGVPLICTPPIPCGNITCVCNWEVCCGPGRCCLVRMPGGQPTGNRCCGGICCRKELCCGNGVCNPDQSNDPINCGACGRVCPRDSVCRNGRCEVCQTGATRCGNVCVDLQTDLNNCGFCGRRCVSPLSSTFSGNFFFYSLDERCIGCPFVTRVTFEMTFTDPGHTSFVLTSFQANDIFFDEDAGSWNGVTLSITLAPNSTAMGTFDQASGHMSLTMMLLFHFFDPQLGSYTTILTLDTRRYAPPKPVSKDNGRVGLQGNSQLAGTARLAGLEFLAQLEGTFSPLPFLLTCAGGQCVVPL